MKHKLVPLAELAEIIPGRHIEEADHNRSKKGVPYITGPSDFGTVQAKASRWTEHPDSMCAPFDVLVVVKGAGVAKTNLAPDEPACIGRQIMAVRARKSQALPLYIFFALTAAKERLKQEALGATVPGLSIENVANVLVPTLSLPDQDRIAKKLKQRLDAAQTAVEAARRQLKELELLRHKLLAQVFDV